MTVPNELAEGSPYPQGAHWDGEGVNFSLFSKHALGVTLCLFNSRGQKEVSQFDLPCRTGDIWHGFLPRAGPGLLYGYRVHGPYAPEQGHRFNANKLLLDPYAQFLWGRLIWSDVLYGYQRGHNRGHLSFDQRDSAAYMPKCVVMPTLEHGEVSRPGTAWEETVIYEMHLKGFTKLRQDLPQNFRGTFSGLAHPETLAYLKHLGVTALELLPIQASVDERFLVEKGLSNYWGYNPIGFFAPQNPYLSGEQFMDLPRAVDVIHRQGLEVIMDVVYNHTAEADCWGPTLSFKGIDNQTYYRLDPEKPAHYVDYTGCGNSLNTQSPQVRQMIVDSLRYWSGEIGVDGFRFDLAPVMGRDGASFEPNGPLFNEIKKDQKLAALKWIAEPWDLGPDGYCLGRFNTGWAEWNDCSRDGIRRFWRGDPGSAGELARRLQGSADRFDHHGRQPWASVNFVTCHDGFTLKDLVTYSRKQNWENGEENRDGHSHEVAHHWGIEGPTEDSAINQLRALQKRNMLATLFLCLGTPMIRAGDEWSQTQKGNNNAYCQDNPISWLDWQLPTAMEHPGVHFLRKLIALRRRFSIFRHPFFLHGKAIADTTGFADIGWYGPDGEALTSKSWQSKDSNGFALVLDENAISKAEHHHSDKSTVMILVNGDDRARSFQTPLPKHPGNWVCLLDTGDPTGATDQVVVAGETLGMRARSLYLFELVQGTRQ